MILDRISFRRKHAAGPAHTSVLDLPPAQYDPATQLPSSIKVGAHSVSPLISVQEVRDHLTLLEAFHSLSITSGSRFHRVMNSAAFDYERWASTVLPVRARRKRSASSERSIPSEPSAQNGYHSQPMSRSGTWSPPESPVSEVSSAASSTTPAVFPALSPEELPPLPVLMCWHAHLLNPAQFAIDAEGTYAWLHAIPFPLAAVAEAIRTNSLPEDLPHVYANNLRPIPSISGWTPPDISAAVLRQVKLIGTIQKLGWLEEAYIYGPAAPFQNGIVRYHAWLDLIAAVDSFLAPTFDITLVWATHELYGARYTSDTARLLGTPLDESILRAEHDPDALKRAGALWKARYKHDYFGRKAPLRRSTV